MQPDQSRSDYGSSTFKNFFCKFYNKNKHLSDLFFHSNSVDVKYFRSNFFIFRDTYLQNFLFIFPKFRINKLNLFDINKVRAMLNTAFC